MPIQGSWGKKGRAFSSTTLPSIGNQAGGVGGGSFLPTPKFRLCKLSTGARGGLVLSPASPIAHRQTHLCVQNPHRPRSQKEQRSMPKEPLPRQVSTQQAGAAPLHSLGRPWFCEDSSERAPRPPPFPPPTVTPAAKQPPSSWPLPSLHRCSLFLIVTRLRSEAAGTPCPPWPHSGPQA